ncbi:MAG: hypothetical protein IJM34_05865 [Lachnospiraceae bacterium]|nr:hypothetical protein [Lachnospiraceae bacterium]
MTERRKLKRWQKIRLLRIGILISSILIFIIIIILIRSGYVWPAVPSISDDHTVFLRKWDDGWHLSWTGAESANKYLIDIHRDSPDGQAVFSAVSEDDQCVLPSDLPENSNICLSITPCKEYRLLGFKGNTVKGSVLDIILHLREADRYFPEWRVDAERKNMTVGCAGGGSDIYHLYRQMDTGELKEVSSLQYTANDKNGSGYGEMVVGFGEDRDFPLPENGEEMKFVLMAERVDGNVRIWEDMTDTITIVRNDLLSNALTAEAVPLGNNRYRISFTETAGKGYRVQRRDEDSFIWDTVAEYGTDDDRIYETENLPSGKEVRYRVTSINEGNTPWSSAEVIIETSYSPIYATVWPVKDLPLYTGTDMTMITDHAHVGESYCVTGEEKGFFRVYTPEGDVYLDSTYCMIDLADYLGGMCTYDITNSYFSLYMAHDHEIYGISGTVIPGYEKVLLDDGTFLVPLLYPVAQRLSRAAEKTLADGYRLRIYDSFRPYVATRFIYDTTETMLDTEAPAELMQRLTLPEYLSLNYEDDAYIGYDVPLPDEDIPAETDVMDEGETGEENNDPEGESTPGAGLTYRQLMTSAGYGLDYFLARSGSMHNLGLALDLTLERRDNAEELPMQSHMHDLSYHSIQSSNNGEAKLLQSYMYGEGFAGIASEWWHFQDNEVRSKYSPPSVYNGVSPEGWRIDNNGIRYRKSDGSYMRDAIQTIGGTEYRFDVDGYVEQG